MLRINEFKVEKSVFRLCYRQSGTCIFFFHDKFREKCSAEKGSVVCE